MSGSLVHVINIEFVLPQCCFIAYCVKITLAQICIIIIIIIVVVVVGGGGGGKLPVC
jgi:hypothetical protein